MDLGKARLQVEVDAAGARSGVNDAVRAFDILKRKGEEAVNGLFSPFDKLKDKLFSLKGLLVGWGVTQIAKDFIEAGRSTEIYTNRLEILLGSVAKGRQLFADMNQFALESPFAFNEIMESATNLAAVVKGGNEEIKAWMPVISDLAASAGLSIQETTGQVVKLISAGAGAADMFRERGILAMLGFTQGVQYTAQQSRDILIKSFDDINSKWKGASAALMNTWEGATSNLGDAWFQFQQRIMVDGGVLNYLKAIVKTLTNEFSEAFGDGTDSAKKFADFLISGLKQGVLAVGVLLNFLKLLNVALKATEAASSGLAVVWNRFKQGAADAANDLAQFNLKSAQSNYEYVRSMSSVPETDARVLDAKEKLRQAMIKSIEASQNYSDAMQGTIDAQERNEKSLDNWFESIQTYTSSSGEQFTRFLEEVEKEFQASNKATAEGNKRNTEYTSGLGQFNAAAGQTIKQQKELNKIREQGNRILEQLDDHISGARGELDPITKAWEDYGQNIKDIDRIWTDFVQHQSQYERVGITESQVRERVKNAIEAETKARDNNLEKAKQQLDIFGQLNKELDQQLLMLGKSDKELFIEGYINKARDAYSALTQAEREQVVWNEEHIESLRNKARAFYEQREIIDQARQVQEEYARTWQTMLNGVGDAVAGFMTGQIKSWKDFKDALIGNVKQMIASIISQFLQLNIINPILNSMFGGMLNLATGAMGSGGGMMGGILSLFTGTAAGGGGSNIVNNAINAFQGGQAGITFGQKIWQGFQQGWSGISNTYNNFMYGNAYNPQSANFVGPPAPGGVTNATGAYGGYNSAAGQALGVAGGIYAGYQRFENRYDTGSGLVGGAAYGAGTYAVGAGMASAAAGTGFAAGMSGAFAIPVVGWIAAIAMLVDMISGGKLFGTSANKFQKGISTLDVTAEGADISAGAIFKGQKPLFGGSYTKWRDFDVPQEMQDSADEFYNGLKEQVQKFAKDMGVELGGIVGGQFQQEFDKKGNLTGVTHTLINGQKYENETQEQFASRLFAENQIAVMNALGVNVTSFTNKFIKDADKYAEAVNGTAQAVSMMKADFGTDKSILQEAENLQELFDITAELAQGSESLADAYVRVRSSTLNFRDMLSVLGVTVDKTGKDFVKFATDITDAAGGVDQAQALYDSFRKYFYTEEEQQGEITTGLQNYARQQVNDLGDSGKGLTFENFRERFEAALPTLSAEQIKDWLEAGDALGQLAEQIGTVKIATTDMKEAFKAYKGVFDHANESLETVSMSATDQLNKNFNQILDIAAAYDGTEQSQDKLLASIQYRYEMEFQYLKLIDQVQKSMTANIQGSIEDIKLSQMDEKEKYDYYKKKADDLAAILPTLTDPQKIAETVAQIQQYESAAWGLLDEKQQAKLADQFINFLQGVQDLANEQLEQSRENVVSQNQTVSQALEDALARNAESNQAAADTQIEAANINLDAAHMHANAEVRVILVDQRSEVGGGGSTRAMLR